MNKPSIVKYASRPLSAMKLPFATLLLMLSPLSVHAQTVVPNAGSILQQIQPVVPPSPSSTGTGLSIEREGGGQLPASAPFEVKTIRITGNTLFDTPTLHALVADAEGKSLTLSELGKVVARITDYYRSHGYPLARAIIPAQTVQSGAVRIEVIEARYGGIGLDNQSRVSDPLLQETLSPLQGGQVIGQAGLDRTLLLLSDIPGVEINATLKPGEAVGTSDLMVNIAPGPVVSGNVVLDDYGSRYTGRARIGATVNLINPLHHGDVLSASGLSSGSGMNYGRLAYESVLNGHGTRLGGGYSALHYRLGNSLAPLDAHGTAQVASLWARHPLVRSRKFNLYGQIQYDRMLLRDHVDVSAIQTDRHLENWTASLAGDARDAFLSDAVNTWSVGWTSGHVGFDNGAAQSADEVTARTQGGFSKLNANLSRLQSLGPRSALYLGFSGQWANANLDPSQKIIAGGPYTVRAYDIGAVSGDTGYWATAEFRHDLGTAWHGQWQALAFLDSAHVTVNRNAWVAGTNSATLSGVGVGLNWAGSNQWGARIHVAAPVGPTPELVPNTASVRAWAEIGMRF